MLTLVEPFMTSSVLDRPHLGCAMLISACQEKGIKTNLVKGQTRYLRNLFVNHSEEIWNLLRTLSEDGFRKIGAIDYKEAIRGTGVKEFQADLKSLYQYVIIDKDPRHHFNIPKVKQFSHLHNLFIELYFYYLINLNCTDLKIIDYYITEILKSRPRYIGFSLHDGHDILSRIIRKRIKALTKIPIIVGGAITPFIDVRKMNRIFEEEFFDYLVIGAGELALPALIESLDNKKEPEGIANVFYKKNGKIKTNKLEVINDLDSLAYPDYSQFDLDLYLTPERILPLQTARGCSWQKCSFCSHHSIDFGNYKTFSIQKVIETIKYLQHTYSCRNFYFHDEELPPSRAKLISESILLDHKIEAVSLETRARLVKEYNNAKLLDLMHTAGFTVIIWGLESGCQRILNLMNKGTEIPIIRQILKKSSKSQIYNICYVIFGFPGETEKERRQTVEFLEDNAKYIDSVHSTTFILSPLSPMHKNPAKWGIDTEENGAYSAKNKTQRQEIDVFFRQSNAKISANIIKVTSDKLRYSMTNHEAAAMLFLSSKYMILSTSVLLAYLENGRLNNIFPFVFGEIEKKDNRIIFHPINIKETPLINKLYPEREITLNKLEERLISLSDGKLSIANIILLIFGDSEAYIGKRDIKKMTVVFFRYLFSRNLALGFARPRHSS
jgi:radical SAM superfamily enzyme YgiQ (UPF0313 family)